MALTGNGYFTYRHFGPGAEIYLNPGSGIYNGWMLDRFRVKSGMTVIGKPGMTTMNET